MRKWLFFFVAALVLVGCKDKPTNEAKQIQEAEQVEQAQEDSVQAKKEMQEKVHAAKASNHLTLFGVSLIGDSQKKVFSLLDGVKGMERLGNDMSKVKFCGVPFNLNISWNHIQNKQAIDNLVMIALKQNKEAFNKIKSRISESYGTPEIDEIKDEKDLFSGHCEWNGECHAQLRSVKMNNEDGLMLIFAHDK
ncbi:MAG: hypothetical protein K6C10_10090 [Prevotella sp.]|nr:hypothetical protein [Prevotella sp.]